MKCFSGVALLQIKRNFLHCVGCFFSNQFVKKKKKIIHQAILQSLRIQDSALSEYVKHLAGINIV